MRYKDNNGKLDEVKLNPFLRWAGGKRRLIKHFINYLPENYDRYWEPFLGSGAMFFALQPEISFLSDTNRALIDCFRYVKDSPNKIHSFLEDHLTKTSRDYYYQIRNLYNNSTESIEQAARFIYLNKTSFNGIYRVNTKGLYNVPYGYKEPPALPSNYELIRASKALKRATLTVHPYEEVLINKNLKKGDFVYLDPPYPPINGTAYFTHYTPERFVWDDQEKVARFANELHDKGCLVMISNSDQEKIRLLYKNWNVFQLPVVRWIAANGSRKKVFELVILNYEPTGKILQQGDD